MNTVISQALATGLPVITTSHSGLPDQVIDGRNGFLVPENDYRALAEKILEYFNQPELWPTFSVFGRDWVMKNYNTENLIEKQIGFYHKLLEKN